MARQVGSSRIQAAKCVPVGLSVAALRRATVRNCVLPPSLENKLTPCRPGRLRKGMAPSLLPSGFYFGGEKTKFRVRDRRVSSGRVSSKSRLPGRPLHRCACAWLEWLRWLRQTETGRVTGRESHEGVRHARRAVVTSHGNGEHAEHGNVGKRASLGRLGKLNLYLCLLSPHLQAFRRESGIGGPIVWTCHDIAPRGGLFLRIQ
jgi:hypothetical protein